MDGVSHKLNTDSAFWKVFWNNQIGIYWICSTRSSSRQSGSERFKYKIDGFVDKYKTRLVVTGRRE